MNQQYDAELRKGLDKIAFWMSQGALAAFAVKGLGVSVWPAGSPAWIAVVPDHPLIAFAAGATSGTLIGIAVTGYRLLRVRARLLSRPTA